MSSVFYGTNSQVLQSSDPDSYTCLDKKDGRKKEKMKINYETVHQMISETKTDLDQRKSGDEGSITITNFLSSALVITTLLQLLPTFAFCVLTDKKNRTSPKLGNLEKLHDNK